MQAFAKGLNLTREDRKRVLTIALPSLFELVLSHLFTMIDTIMLGRGIIRNPELAEQIQKLYDPEHGEISEVAKAAAVPDQFDKATFRAFHDDLIEAYTEYMYGEKPVLYKMKELWFYMMSMFPEHEKLYKKIMKTNRLDEYGSYMDELFS